MTALLSTRLQPQENRPELKAVPQPRRQLGMAGFIAVVVLILGGGMVGVLILNTMLQGQAFEVRRTQAEANALANRVSDLEAELATASSVQNLGVLAQQIGMKPNPYPVQLRLPDGKVIGDPSQVTGREIPSVRYVTDQQAAAELQARRAAEAKAKAEAAAKKEAEAKAKAEAAAKAKAEAAAKAKAEAAAKQSSQATAQPQASSTTAKQTQGAQ